MYKSFTIVKNVGVFIVNRSLILFENFVMLTEKLTKNKLQLERATPLGYAQPLRSPEGEISLDFHGKKPGRGAYLCPSPDCLKRARKAKALERAFALPIPDPVYDALAAQMEGGGLDG